MRRYLAILAALALLFTSALAETAESRETELRARAEELCDALLAGAFETVEAEFDETMAAMLSADALEAGWNSVVSMLGAHGGRASVSFEEQAPYFTVQIQERFENSGLLVKFVFDGDGRVAGLQTTLTALEDAAEEDGPWIEVELTVAADPAYPLGATLCLPEGVDHPPVVVLVHGSGSSDRDEAIFQNKPFRDLAHGLAVRGVATLRYDKRTYAYPECAGESGMDIDIRGEMLDDVNAAIDLLRGDAHVDGSRIFVLGHSLGGMMIPAIAAENPDLAGAVSVAGSLRRLWEIVYDQNLEVIAGYSDAELSEEERALLDAQTAQIEADVEALRGGANGLPDDSLLLGIPVRYWRSLEDCAGVNFIDGISLPLLILQGGADFQVYPDVDYPLWQEALAGRENVQFHLYEGLNHLMMPTQGLRDLTEYAIPGQVSGEVISDIADFVLAN